MGQCLNDRNTCGNHPKKSFFDCGCPLGPICGLNSKTMANVKTGKSKVWSEIFSSIGKYTID